MTKIVTFNMNPKFTEIMLNSFMVITTAQLYSTNPELRFCAGSNPDCGMLEIVTMRISDNGLGWK